MVGLCFLLRTVRVIVIILFQHLLVILSIYHKQNTVKGKGQIWWVLLTLINRAINLNASSPGFFLMEKSILNTLFQIAFL